MARYQRQLILPEVGIDGQRRLLASRVLVVGAGALGSAAATYLAAAGVGTLGLLDGDRVDITNLHRQILHATGDVGENKSTSGAMRLRALNPDITIVEHQEFLSRDNALALVEQYDLVVNGSDNFPTRYLLNDAAWFKGRPWVDAAILRFEGQLAVFRPGRGCYRCLFPMPPPPGAVPSCAEAGILGAVAGVLGSMEAVEAIKVLLGLAQDEPSRLLLYDAWHSSWQSVPFHPDPRCPLCGEHPSLFELVDYEGFCGVPLPTSEAASDGAPRYELPLAEAARLVQAGAVEIVDVRSPDEFCRGHLPGARQTALDALDQALALPSDRPILTVCTVGIRSQYAAQYLRTRGREAWSLQGGTAEWVNGGHPWVLAGEDASI
jgi:molybdopterin/thiamine biosynthesis adenylyltransferase/rhodanese-related sulfurtransferase